MNFNLDETSRHHSKKCSVSYKIQSGKRQKVNSITAPVMTSCKNYKAQAIVVMERAEIHLALKVLNFLKFP